jgi:hypothetical protein
VKRTIFFVSWTRCFVFRVGLLAPLAGVLLFGLAVGAGSLLAPGSALAAEALFRVEQRWHNFPNPAVTTPGGAGMYQAYIQPYATNFTTGMGATYPPGIAIVEPGNPIGGAFTLPTGFINVTGTYSWTPKTAWPGYTTIYYSVYYNGPGVFGPNHGATGPTRVVFPTTMGNPYPNFATGNPVTPTTTFDGLYDFSRVGSINVTPGPNRFGGTFRMFYRPEAFYYQYIYNFSPAIYKAYGGFSCLDEGVFDCTPGNFKSSIGDITAGYRITRFLMSVTTMYSSPSSVPGTILYKATTPTTPYGEAPTPDGNASYITGAHQYLRLIHPWTTGFASVHNPIGSPNIITPQAQGYDISLSGADITVTRTDWNQNWNYQLQTITTTTATSKQYMFGVRRVVSMVRPRLIHTYSVPLDPTADPITQTWPAARLWAMKVFFVPEPTGLLMLGTGLGLLVVLHRVSRPTGEQR